MGINGFSLFRGRAFTKSFKARDDPFKQAHDVRPGRLEYPLFDKTDHLDHMLISESQVAMN